jgi:hypothetical protein
MTGHSPKKGRLLSYGQRANLISLLKRSQYLLIFSRAYLLFQWPVMLDEIEVA